MASRMSLDSTKSSKACPRKTTSYSAYEAFMRSNDGHVEPKIPSNKNVGTYCGDGTWTWDTDLHETGAGFNDDDKQFEALTTHDITYVHPPISKEEIQEGTSLSDIQPPSQISSSFYDDDFPQQIPQDQPVCSQESEDELFLRNFKPIPAQKKTTKTIFSVVQSMDNRDPVLPKSKDQSQQVTSQGSGFQAQSQKEVKVERNLTKKEKIHISASKHPVQTNVPEDTLILHQTSKAFSTTIYLENPTSHFIGYKVFCNYKAVVLFFVTPKTGIIPPRSQVNVVVKTRSLNVLPRESSELMIGTKFMVKVFQMLDDDERRLPVYFDMLSKERPDLIFTQVIDKIVISFPDNLDGRKSALDVVGDDKLEQYSKDSISGWGSLENLKNNGIQNMVLLANQEMRRSLIDMNIFQKRMTWLICGSISILPFGFVYSLFKDYLSFS